MTPGRRSLFKTSFSWRCWPLAVSPARMPERPAAVLPQTPPTRPDEVAVARSTAGMQNPHQLARHQLQKATRGPPSQARSWQLRKNPSGVRHFIQRRALGGHRNTDVEAHEKQRRDSRHWKGDVE
jgi:hypothetical protein